MTTFWIILFGGMTRASVYFLIASGLTLVFGVGKVINFAHGSLYVLGMYVTYSVVVDLLKGAQFAFWVGLLLTPLILAGVGMLLEIVLLRRVYGKEHLMQLLLTFGLVYVFSDIYRIGWGVMPKMVPRPELLGVRIEVFDTIIPSFNLFVIGCAAFVYVILDLVLTKTRFGRLSKAVAFDGGMLEILGVNVNRVYTLIFGVGSFLAGLGGCLATQLSTASLGMDAHITILAFILVIVGGVGSVGGAAIAAVIVGLVEAFGALFLPEFVLVLIYLVMVLVLLVRPFGLLGRPAF